MTLEAARLGAAMVTFYLERISAEPSAPSACRLRCLDRSAVDTGAEFESPSGAPLGYDRGSPVGEMLPGPAEPRALVERVAQSGERVATRVARVSVARTTSVRMRPSARRPVRGMCLEFCRALGRCRCVRARARAMVCGALHAAVVVAIAVARCAIAPMSVHADRALCEAHLKTRT